MLPAPIRRSQDPLIRTHLGRFALIDSMWAFRIRQCQRTAGTPVSISSRLAQPVHCRGERVTRRQPPVRLFAITAWNMASNAGRSIGSPW